MHTKTFVKKTATIFFWTLICFTVATLSCQSGESLDDLLNSVRAATGHETLRQWDKGLEIAGTGVAHGLESRFRFCLLADGSFTMDVDSRLKQTSGFDGQRGWETDCSGMGYPLDFWELEVQKLIAWFVGTHWLDGDCALSVHLNEDSDSGESRRIAVRVGDGAVEAAFHIDRETFLPRKLTWRTMAEENCLVLDDFRPVEGFVFPHTITISEGGETTRISITDLSAATDGTVDACRPVSDEPRDTLFKKGVPRTAELKRASTGHLLVRPTIDGNDTTWFTLDTGAGINVVDRAFAKDVGMERFGRCTATGVGGRVDIGYCKGKSISLGPLTIQDPIYYEIDFSPMNPFRKTKRGGILGYGFFRRCLVEIDYKADKIVLAEPGSWDDRKAAWHKIVFSDHIPGLRCTLSDGAEGFFTLDTGADTTVTLNRPFVEKHNLLEGRDLKEVGLGGVGGTITCYYGPLEWFELAGHRFEKPNVLFAGADEGIFTDRVVAGIIGNGFLEHFVLLIDYPNQRIGFVERD